MVQVESDDSEAVHVYVLLYKSDAIGVLQIQEYVLVIAIQLVHCITLEVV